mgnify:FL=1
MVIIKEIFQGLVVSIIFIFFVLTAIIILNYEKIFIKYNIDKLPSVAMENTFKIRYNKCKYFMEESNGL